MENFIETRQAYQRLQSKYSAGKLGKAAFQQAAENLTIQDQFGDMWQIGVASGNWYRFDGRVWVEDYPPPPDLGLSPTSPATHEKTALNLAAVEKPAPWHIVIESGTSAGQRIPIDQDLLLGRDRNINMHIDDPQASRRHALIQKSGQEYLLTDQNSTNGTELNGKPVNQPAILKHGDRISIGDTQIRVEGDPASDPATVISHKPVEVISAPTPPPPHPTSVPPPSSRASQPPPAPRVSRPVHAPKPKSRRGCTCLIIGLVVILAIVACLAALVFGGVIMFPDALAPFVDIPTVFGTQAPVVIENYLDYSICYVYINPSTSGDWGDDWLGDDETIPPGGSYTFWVNTSESIDMQVLDCDQTLLDVQHGTPLTSEGITYTLTPNP